MQRRMIVWAISVTLLLCSSTIFGWMLTLAIKPHRPDYNKIWGIAPVRTATTVRDTTIVSRQYTDFRPAEIPPIELAQELQQSLESVANFLNNGQHDRFIERFDIQRLAEEEIAHGVYVFLSQQPTLTKLEAAHQEIIRDLQTLASENPTVFPQGQVRIESMMPSPDRTELLCLARHTSPTSGTRFTRWWLKQSPQGSWLVYDFDFPNTRLRFSTIRNYLLDASIREHSAVGMMPLNANIRTTDLDAFQRYQLAFNELMLAGSVTDPAGVRAAQWTESIEAEPMLAYVQAARYSARARLEALRGNTARAEAALAAIPQSLSNAAHVRMARAIVLNAQKKYPEARAAIRHYREAVGDDPIAYLEDAKAIAAIDGPATALAELKKGWSVFPGDEAIAMELLRRLPAGERESFGEQIGTLNRPNVLSTVARLFEGQSRDIVNAVGVGYLKAQPNDETAIDLMITIKVALGQTQAAMDILKRANEEVRKYIAIHLTYRALNQTSPVELFRVLSGAGEGRNAFKQLVLSLGYRLLETPVAPADRDQLRTSLQSLIAIHRAADASDRFLRYADAVIDSAAGDDAKADRELSMALAQMPIERTERYPWTMVFKIFEEEREPFRRLRTSLLAKRFQWKKAYEQITPAVDTFDQLAEYLRQTGDFQGLAELVELHGKQHPGDLELIAWRAEVQYRNKNYEQAIACDRSYRDKSGKDNRHVARMYERMIRSLVKLNRLDDAEETLEESRGSIQNFPLMGGLIAAARGDADRLLAQMESTQTLVPALWYSDPDLGPLLKGPAFERVRQKYPPPVR